MLRQLAVHVIRLGGWRGPQEYHNNGPVLARQRANGYVLMGTRILGLQAKNGSEWLGEWLRRLFGGS